MKLSITDFDKIKELEGKNAIVVISNGKMKAAELPSHGVIEITTHDDKVTFLENKVKEKF